jgi:hypothetical protein
VKQRKVLNVGIAADMNAVDVAAYYHAGPDAGIIADPDLTDNMRCGININLFADLRRKNPERFCFQLFFEE